ncbi:beta strand repeat-containing protein [Paracidobacterium acidisoli]|uniref:beta strand repeat-containing protein n=1 Tax=Paracidobacterium acidisoli TaxID=2303751 RepID=UPI0013148838|nr:SBBP repeat-containing protein [Paracidobacterium acidisoli]MBT9330185.1 SBBP repeat-containing protein [Paracidobacterium acidisoli]
MLFLKDPNGVPGADGAYSGLNSEYALWVRQTGFSVVTTHVENHIAGVQLRFAGAMPAGAMRAEQSPTKLNEYIGSDRSKWQENLPTYRRLITSEIYPGIHVEYYGTGSHLEHDFVIAPEAEPARVVIDVGGAEKIAREADGSLRLMTRSGVVNMLRPQAYQTNKDGSRRSIAAEYVVAGNSIRFRLADYDRHRELIIDPVIVWSTFLNASGTLSTGTTVTGIVSDASGNLYLTGNVTSTAASTAFDSAGFFGPGSAVANEDGNNPSDNTADAFVAALPANGEGAEASWVTIIGGTLGATSSAITLAPTTPGLIYFGGSTASVDFPATSGAYSTSRGSIASVGWIASLNLNGAIQSATFVPASSGTTVTIAGLAVDSSGNVTAALGVDPTGTFPTTANALGYTTNPGAAVLVLNGTLTGSAQLATYLGGFTGTTTLASVAVDGLGGIYLAGESTGDFPEAGAFSQTNSFAHNSSDGSTGDVFVAKITPPVGAATTYGVAYAAWLSGSAADEASGLALDAAGNAYAFGTTASSDLRANFTYTNTAGPVTAPTAGTLNGTAMQLVFPAKSTGGTPGGYLAKVDATGKPVGFTYLGGDGSDFLQGGTLDSNGNVVLVGSTDSTSGKFVPSVAATLPSDMQNAAGTHAFAVQIKGDLSAGLYDANLGPVGTGPATAAITADAQGLSYAALNLTGVAYASASGLQSGQGSSASTPYVAALAAATPGTGAGFRVASATNNYGANGLAAGDAVSWIWTLTGQNGGAKDVVVNLPVTASANSAFTVTGATGTASPGSCVTGAGGLTCIIPSLGDGSSVTVTAALTLGASGGPAAGLTLMATGYDAEGDQISLNQASAPQLSLSIAQSSATVYAAASQTVALAFSGTAEETYTFKVSNASGYVGSNVVITPSLPANFVAVTVSPSTCTAMTCSIATLAANGSSSYSITGYYSDSALFPDATPVTVLQDVNATAVATGTTAVDTTKVTTTVNRGFSIGNFSVSGPGASSFVLGTNIALTYNLTNTGPGAVYGLQLGNTLTVGGLTINVVSTGSGISCSSFGSCTIPVLPADGVAHAFTATVVFPDGPAPVNASLGSGTPVTVGSTITVPTGFTEISGSNTGSLGPITVERSAHLKVNTSQSAYSGAQTAFNLGDTVTYTVTVTNSGPNQTGTTDTLQLTPPSGSAAFTVTNIAVPAGGSCGTGSNPLCTLPSIPANHSVTFTVQGSYADTATNAAVTGAVIPEAFSAVSTLRSASDSNAAGTASGDNTATVNSPVHRTATLVIPTPTATGGSLSCPAGQSPCVYMANTIASPYGPNDIASYTVQVSNNGPDIATGVSFTLPLPQALNGATAHIVNVTTGPVETPGTPAFGSAVSCTATAASISCSGGNLPVGTNVLTVTFAGTYDAATVPTASTAVAAASTATVSTTAASAGQPASGSTTVASALPSIYVARAVHLKLTKTRNIAIDIPAATFAIRTDGNGQPVINLDEHPGQLIAGANDALEFDFTLSNLGANAAPAGWTTVTEMLPPYFEIVTAPNPSVASCVVAGATITAGYMTGAGGAAMSCTLSGSLAGGSALSPAGACTVNAAFLCYQGKFIDGKGAAADITGSPVSGWTPEIPLIAASSKAVSTNGMTLVPDAVDPVSNSDAASGTIPFSVQRVVHLHVLSSKIMQTNETALAPVGGVSGAGIAEAQTAVQGGAVANYLRYEATVVNDGPNWSVQPQLTAATDKNFTLVGEPLNGAVIAYASTAAAGSGTSTGQALGPLSQMSSAAELFDFDGFYGLSAFANENCDVQTGAPANSLCGTTAQTQAFAFGSVADAKAEDNRNGNVPLPPLLAILPVTVVNTPVGSSFTLQPYDPAQTAGSNVPLTLTIPAVSQAGITSVEQVKASQSDGDLPVAAAATAAYAKGAKLYVYGSPSTSNATQPGPYYYESASDAAITGMTTVCIANPPEVFVKPERALLWALQGVPSGTMQSGAISVQSDGVFNVAPPNASVPIAEISGATEQEQFTDGYPTVTAGGKSVLNSALGKPFCGTVDGYANGALSYPASGNVTASGSPMKLALLEPLNFAPTFGTNAALSTPTGTSGGKGVTASTYTLDLSIASGGVFDYNDGEPCYLGGQRTACHDNNYLTTWLFTGNNLLQPPQPVSPSASLVSLGGSAVPIYAYPGTNNPMAPFSQVPSAGKQSVTLLTGASLNVVVTDQIGSQTFNQESFCDPNVQGAGYAYLAASSCNAQAIAASTPSQSQALPLTKNNVTVPGAEVLYLPSPGGAGGGVTVGGYLDPDVQVPNEPASCAASESNCVSAGYAVPTIQAGQSQAFAWESLYFLASGNAGVPYQLSCASVSTLGGSAVQFTSVSGSSWAASSLGITCALNPTGYTFTNSTIPGVVIGTTATVARMERPAIGGSPGLPSKFFLSLLAPWMIVPLTFRRKWMQGNTRFMVVVWLLAGLAMCTGLMACGAGPSVPATTSGLAATPSGTYAIAVNYSGGGASGTHYFYITVK